MSKLLQQMLDRAGVSRDPVKLDPKRAELAGAITRTLINEVLRDVKAAKQQSAASQGETPK